MLVTNCLQDWVPRGWKEPLNILFAKEMGLKGRRGWVPEEEVWEQSPSGLLPPKAETTQVTSLGRREIQQSPQAPPGFRFRAMNHGIISVQKSLWRSLVQGGPTSKLEPASKLEHVAQGHVQLCSGYFQGWRKPVCRCPFASLAPFAF